MLFRSIILCLLFTTTAAVSFAQQAGSFQYANQLLQQGNYEEALEIYQQILHQNPDNVPVIERKTSTLVRLKRYEEAVKLLSGFIERNAGYPNLTVKVGEIYHIQGERDKALAWWDQIIEDNKQNVQVYRLVAETMVERREHERAAYLYRDAREVMQNDQMFGFDIAQNFTAAGNYEETMREYSHLLTVNPGFISAIQRQIARYDDEFYKDTGIMELEEASRSLRAGSEAWVSHRQMLIWLYNERELYRRSFATASSLEESLGGESYPLFELGTRLVNLNQYELAQDAFERYTNDPDHELYAEARKHLAQLNIRHARYLKEYNLDFGSKADTMYETAYRLLSELNETKPNYRGMGEIRAILVEISLDYLQDSTRAMEWYTAFEANARGSGDEILGNYLHGRILTFQQDFTQARLSLSRANRASGTGEMAHKTRFFLSLNDFLAGDFDYAQLQMRSLQRQATSYYANDALRLRSVLQEGIVKDSTTAELKKYAKAIYQQNSGEYTEALQTLKHFTDFSSSLPLQTEAILLASQIMKPYAPDTAFYLLDAFLHSGLGSSQKERVNWERARLADALIHVDEEYSEPSAEMEQVLSAYKDTESLKQAADRFKPGSAEGGSLARTLDIAQVSQLYEDLIISFPNGFYASAARERIRGLQQSTMILNP